jgi:hypothetical protein
MEQIRTGNTRRSIRRHRAPSGFTPVVGCEALPEGLELEDEVFDESMDYLDLDHNIMEAANYMVKEGHAKNTRKSYTPKHEEYTEYCQAMYAADALRTIIDPDKVFRFVVYQCNREKKKKGAKKKRGYSSNCNLWAF